MTAPVFSYRLKPDTPATFADLDLVRLRSAVTTDDGDEVPAGTRGTVVAVYAEGAAYEVEFTAGLATVSGADLVGA